MSDSDLEIKEMSAMGGGAVAGSSGPRKRKMMFESEIPYSDRMKFLEELKLRSIIQESIKILKEEQRDIDDVPHNSTGINVLEDLLKKIIPVIEDSYKSLTTSEEQRDSFRAHIINAIQSSLSQAKITSPEDNLSISLKEEETELGDGDKENDKFIDIYNSEPEKDKFGIPGKDLTGRNMAETTYDKIEKTILDSYSVLGNHEDQKLFYDYLLTNMKLYFDKFENELSSTPSEPLAGDENVETTDIV